MKSTTQAEIFYGKVLDLLLEEKIPFMVGGTYAFSAYTGVERFSKDFDIFVAKKDLPKLLKLLLRFGFATELVDPLWLAKVYHDDAFVDLIFAERHSMYIIDTTWLTHAKKGTVLKKNLLLMPLEQIIRTKCYVQFRNKYDGSDINILLLQYGEKLDWQWLVKCIGPHWQLLFAHLINFTFVFPDSKDVIPMWVIDEYLNRTRKLFDTNNIQDKRTRGSLISYEYDAFAEKWGFTPVERLE